MTVCVSWSLYIFFTLFICYSMQALWQQLSQAYVYPRAMPACVRHLKFSHQMLALQLTGYVCV